MGKRSISIIGIWVIFVTLMILLISTGCSGYRHYNFHNRLYDCYFEYPATNLASSVTDDENIAVVTVYIPMIGFCNLMDEHITVSIMEKSPGHDNSSDWIQDTLDFYQTGSNYFGFELISRDNTTVDGAQGEVIHYTYNRRDLEPEIVNNQLVPAEKTPALSYTACFEKGDYLFEVEINAVAKRSEQAKQDFYHMLETFKFLE